MRVLFRFEANQTIGMGHAMRCLGLAQELIDHGHDCQALTLESPAGYLNAWQEEAGQHPDRLTMVKAAGTRAAGSKEDVLQTIVSCSTFKADWLVLDNYAFGPDYRLAVASSPYHRLYFEDAGMQEADADILLNQNCREGENVRRETGGMLFLAGTRYFQARRNVREARMNRDASCENTMRVLVTLGGEDGTNCGLHVCKALHPLLPRNVHLVLACTAGKNGWADAQAFAATHSNVEVHLRPDLVPLMQRAAVAICGGGITSLELACLGVPSVVLVLADNQTQGANALAAQGCAYLAHTLEEAASLAAALISDSEALHGLASQAANMVDGLGAARVVEEMERIDRKVSHDNA